MAPLRTRRRTGKAVSPLPTRADVKAMIASSRLANAELKAYNYTQTGQTSNTGGTVWNLSQGIVIGDTFNSRDGAQINLRHVRLHLSANVTSISGALRYVLVLDHMCTGTAPTPSDILGNATFIDDYDPRIQLEGRRFNILFDRTVDVSVTGRQVVSTLIDRKINAKITYLGDTDVAASNGKNSLFLLVIGSNISVTYQYNSMIRFIDQ